MHPARGERPWRKAAAFLWRRRRVLVAIAWRAGFWVSVLLLADAGAATLGAEGGGSPSAVPFAVGLCLAAPGAVFAPTFGSRVVACLLGAAHALLGAAVHAAGPWG